MNIFVNVTILDDFNQIFTYQLKYHNIQPDDFPKKEEPIPIVDVDKRTDKKKLVLIIISAIFGCIYNFFCL